MHVAQQLFLDSFDVEVDGKAGTHHDLFDDWEVSDRFGIVVDESLGALGGSLLIELAIALFYAVDPERRSSRATYPEIYLFHAGGPHGDYSNFDFWPPRKEVFVPSAQPLELLEAINDRGVTRLAVPSRAPADVAVFGDGPSTWAELGNATGRLRSCFLYDSSGHVDGAQITLRSADERTKENIRDTLTMTTHLPEPGHFDDPHGQMAIDERRWIQIVAARKAAEGPTDPEAIESQNSYLLAGSDVLEQTYRLVEASEALAHLASLGH
jgi:hypothetical protein